MKVEISINYRKNESGRPIDVTREMVCDDHQVYMDRMPIDQYCNVLKASVDAISVIENYLIGLDYSDNNTLYVGNHRQDRVKDRKNIRGFFKLISTKLFFEELKFRIQLLKIRRKNKLLCFKPASFIKLTKTGINSNNNTGIFRDMFDG